MFIRLNTISLFAHHGVYDEEISNGNNFEIDLEIEIPDSLAMTTDSLSDALDYTKLYTLVVSVSESRRYNLLEAFAHNICAKIFESFPMILNIGVKVRKMKPPVGGDVKYVEVEFRKNA